MEPFSRTWLEVDLSASASNFRLLRELARPASVMAVIKADAYGLGAARLCDVLVKAGAARVGVATAREAMALPTPPVPVQVMSAVFPEELPWLVGNGIGIPLADLSMAAEIDRAAAAAGKMAKVHIKLDTGMGRLGLLMDDLGDLCAMARDLPHVEFEGIFTHFPLSTEHEAGFCRRQMADVRRAVAMLADAGISPRWRHVANSDAICHLPEAAQPPFNLVRAGLAMHGLVDVGESRPAGLSTVATLRSRLVSVRRLPAGMSVGYGATFRLSRPTLIGTVAAGYADGIPLALSNSGHVLLHGKRCRIAGRISMDYTTIDLTDAPEAAPGDVVTLFGRDGDCEISPADWAAVKKTHPYDIICSVSPRVPRVFSPHSRE